MGTKKQFIEDEELIKLANEVIVEHKLDYCSNARIKFLFVDPYISKTVLGRCILPSKELAYFGDFDYLVEISKKTWDKFEEKERKILLWHELLHIYVDINEQDNEKCFKLIQHDVQDFYHIIKEHGIDWFTKMKTITASVYDFQKGEQDKIKL